MAFVLSIFAFLFLIPYEVYASDVLSLPTIHIGLHSGATSSDPSSLPVAALNQTDQFMRWMLGRQYADRFEDLTLSISSKGIEAESKGNGFVDTLNIKGTIYFNDKTAPSFYDLYTFLQQSFDKSEYVFLQMLKSSHDGFLSAIQSADIQVDSQPTTDQPKSSWNTLVIVAVAVAGAVFLAFVLCVICICCLGDSEDEQTTLEVKRTLSTGTAIGSGESQTELASEVNIGARAAKKATLQEHLELRSITSQDSSKFTYNPRSEMTDGCFTFQTYDREKKAAMHDHNTWKKSGTLREEEADGVEVPFGEDLSAIGNGKDFNQNDDGDNDSRGGSSTSSILLNTTDIFSPNRGNTTFEQASMAGMSEVGIGIDDDVEQSRRIPSTINSRRIPSFPRNVDEDLSELGNQVAAHRKESPYSIRKDGDSFY